MELETGLSGMGMYVQRGKMTKLLSQKGLETKL